jgi:hypothetical protein
MSETATTAPNPLISDRLAPVFNDSTPETFQATGDSIPVFPSGPRPRGLHNTKNAGTDSSSALTESEYRTLQDAYDFFNGALFSGKLPQVLITLQRHARARGYFSAERFQHRGPGQERIHEIALNPDGFVGRSDEKILSTLVHEMTHVWQEELGERGRGRYHNREWAQKMHSIGLMPSDTGEPGGKTTGDRVSHYILPDGLFATECCRFLKDAHLSWESASENGEVANPTRSVTRCKFTCPICGDNLWGRAGAEPACGRCTGATGELIPLLPEGARELAPNLAVASYAPKSKYDNVLKFLTEALIKAKHLKLSKEDVLPPLVDVACAVALGLGGEEGLRVAMLQMEDRLRDWHAGTFPETNEEVAQ